MGNATVGDFKKFLEQFDDSAEIGVIMGGYGGAVTDYYLMQDFEDEGIENPSPVPYPTLFCGIGELEPSHPPKGDDPARLMELHMNGSADDPVWARQHIARIVFGSDNERIRELCEILWRTYVKTE